MTENEINTKVREWLTENGYKYKGVLNTKPNEKANPSGYGQVPIPLPSGDRSILIDHQGFNDRTKDLLWVEAKGGGDNLSELMEGFIRVSVACFYGGGRGLLAVDSEACQRMLLQRDFLRAIGIASERSLGLLDGEKGKVYWL